MVSARGDDVFAVFERAPAALEAALAIQRAMREAVAGERDVRLRIGLHRGRPALTDTGYVGLSVHAAARLCFAAHGGQIVCPSAVAPRSASRPRRRHAADLGRWRFRGLPEPVACSRRTPPACRPTSRPCARPSPPPDRRRQRAMRAAHPCA